MAWNNNKHLLSHIFHVSRIQEGLRVSREAAVQMLAGAPVTCLASTEGSTSKMPLSHGLQVRLAVGCAIGLLHCSHNTMVGFTRSKLSKRTRWKQLCIYDPVWEFTYHNAILCWSHRWDQYNLGKDYIGHELFRTIQEMALYICVHRRHIWQNLLQYYLQWQGVAGNLDFHSERNLTG